MKVGSTTNWSQRFGEDNRYRDLAILGASISIYAFDLGTSPTTSAGDLEVLVRNELWKLTLPGVAHKHWIPYDGAKRSGNARPPANDPYAKAVRRTVESPSNFDLGTRLTTTSLAGLAPVARVDLNRDGWRPSVDGLAANHRYLYILETRQEGVGAAKKILKIGITGENGTTPVGGYSSRFSQYINTAVNYQGGATFGYGTSGVTVHMYDVTTLVGAQGTTDEQKARHLAMEMEIRSSLYNQGYRLPSDHEGEDVWREPGDTFKRSLYNG